nr:integrase, catalytic region, zinc finger, CCHC-type, peptidase aspartic, catalytic [Tanacetum cinerariifolium]
TKEKPFTTYVRFAKLINNMWNIKMNMSKMQLNFKFVNKMLHEWGRFVTAMKLNKGQGNNARVTGAASYGGAHNRVGNTNLAQERQIKCYNYNDLVYDKVGPSYDLNILSEVHDHENYQDVVCKLYGVHEMHDHVQPNCVVDSNAECTSDSNMILYDQYVKDNAESVVHNIVSSVPHDVPLMIINEMHEQTAQYVSVNAHTKVVNASLTAKLAIYKEQVELYKRRAKFELTKRDQKIKE